MAKSFGISFLDCFQEDITPNSGSACIWYDSDTGMLKVAHYIWTGSGAWSAGPDAPAYREHASAAGTQNSFLFWGGNNPSDLGDTVNFNGVSFGQEADFLDSYQGFSSGHGVQNAALSIGGSGIISGSTAGLQVISFNGAVWTKEANLGPTQFNTHAGFGSQNSSIVAGGSISPGACVCSFNGSSWTSETGLTTSRCRFSGTGLSNSGYVVAGWCTPVALSCTEEWDGSSWSGGGSTPVGGQWGNSVGTQNDGFLFDFSAPPTYPRLKYDGFSWSTDSSYSTCKDRSIGGGISNNAVSVSGCQIGPGVETTCTLLYNTTGSIVICASGIKL